MTDDLVPPVVLHTRVVTGTGGGPEKTILNSPRFLKQHGYHGLCAFMHPPDDPGFEEIRQRGMAAETEVISIPDRGATDWRSIKQMLRLCRRLGVTIWHGHDYKSNCLGLLLRRFHRMHLVSTVHGWVDMTGRMPLYSRIDRWALKRYQQVIAVSPDLLERCAEAGVRRDRLTLIENAIDCEQYRRSMSLEDAKRKIGVSPERILIGAVGRLNPEKGFNNLIEAVSQVRAEGHDVELVIAGEGSERNHLETLIASQPEPDRFRLLGHCSNVIDLYHAMDVYALSSLREGLPNVLLEAMAMSVPVVATRIAGVPKLIEDGVNGILVEPGNKEELAAALTNLIDGVTMRNQLATAGREVIENRYSFTNRMQAMVNLYNNP
ncbi:glycosyltransferase family 4 protein [Thalassoroseus pseudoceratinae]|uniref:glycosyltransferase family 4 protein n=1 Tax=Thalassoroseus pseudoceratinae TaxID=2713176 RepID=UPI00141F5A34|nr:glycosyltransferase family 4 protein [Thalassoroseus pseudoceratinae]